MRSTYNEARNTRRYPYSIFPSGRTYFGREIDGDTVFDEVRIHASPDAHEIGKVYLRNAGERVTQVPGIVTGVFNADTDVFRYLRDDPEVAIVLTKVKDGSCAVTYESLAYPDRQLNQEEFHASHWLTDLMHPFHVDDRDLFFEHLTRDLRYSAPAEGELQRFIFPGVVEGAQRRYYKRDDSPSAPNTNSAAETSLVLLGWTPGIPYGGGRLHAVDVLDAPGAVSVSTPQRVYHRRKDQAESIAALARKWNEYWTGLTTSEQGISTRMTMRKHVEHAIGRMWADRPNENSIDVFYEGETGAQARDARDAEDWMLGNMEFWAYRWNFGVLALALNEGSNRSLLESQLGDYTFCHLNLDGSVGDRLSNGADGITQATWDAYQSTHYAAALQHGA